MEIQSPPSTDLRTGEQRRPPRLLRFSLLSFLLTVSLVCVSVSHYQVERERARLKQKNDELLTELGHLVIHDPKKAYFRAIESAEDLTWRFRVYLPPEKQYLVGAKFGNGGGFTSLHNQRHFTLTVALRRNANGEWRTRIFMPGQSLDSGADAEFAEQLLKNNGLQFARSDQKELDPDKPIDLLHYPKGNIRISIEPGPFDDYLKRQQQRMSPSREHR